MHLLHTTIIIVFTILPFLPLKGAENNALLNYQQKPLSIMYTPWRESYNGKLSKERQSHAENNNKPCIFCKIITDGTNDEKELILHRESNIILALAMQPYVESGFHFLIIPHQHTKEFHRLSKTTQDQINTVTYKICSYFSSQAQEICCNTNQGLYAGASIPNHHHRHIIINNKPRLYNIIEALEKISPTIDLQKLFETLKPQISTLYCQELRKELSIPYLKTDCYYCNIVNNGKSHDTNLIIHRGTHTTTMLCHRPVYFGDIDIIPNTHSEAIEDISEEIYTEMNDITLKIYPLLLDILQKEDVNMGFISYGKKGNNKEHIRQQISARDNTPQASPIVRVNYFTARILPFYNQLLSRWKEQEKIS